MTDQAYGEAIVRVLGTGDAAATRFWNTCYLVEAAGKRLLIDCGFTIKYALRDVGLTLADIDAVFITHVHGDHVHGMERLGFESRYDFKRRPQLLLAPGLREPLWDYCLRGTMGAAAERPNQLEDFFDVVELGSDGFTWGGVDFRLFATPHVPNKVSYGLIINDSLILTSDTRPIDWLAADRSDRVILHDCCLSPANPVHTTVDEILAFYPAAVRKRMWAIHYGDEIERFRDILESGLAGIVAQGQTFVVGKRGPKS